MSRRPKDRELTERDLDILREVITTFLLSGEPVSSRRVAKQEHHNLSAASIRNTMADLEELGYLTQPHSSAGRVPTPRGYHLFIDSLMEAETLPEYERRYINESLNGSLRDAGQMASATSQLLSELSRQVGVVLTPDVFRTVLRHVEFVPLSESRVLCVSVSVSGFVDNKIIDTGEPVPREELVRISNYLNDNFAGLTLGAIRDRLLLLMDDERSEVDELMKRAIGFARQGLDFDHGPGVLLDGAESLLSQPELADVERVRRLFQTFADKARLVSLLNRCMEGPGVRVFIGEDSELTSELDFSLIVTSYGDGERLVGSLGIFGPSRMEYPRVIPLVEHLGRQLSRALAATR